jgi:hypothetical protein
MSEPPRTRRIDSAFWPAVSNRWFYVHLMIWCVLAPMILVAHIQYRWMINMAVSIASGILGAELYGSRRRWLAMRAWIMGESESTKASNTVTPPKRFRVTPSPAAHRRN